MSPTPRSSLDRFLDHVGALPPTPEACWLWTGRMHPWGYGTFWWRDGVNASRSLNAHRAAYLLFVGTIPASLHIDHLCRNRACVNPAHLEAVTMRENILRGTAPPAHNARATVCKRGHPFTPENTFTRSNGKRLCATCERARWKRENARRRRVALERVEAYYRQEEVACRSHDSLSAQ